MRHGSRGLAVAAVLGIAVAIGAGSASAQVTGEDERCITAFSKAVRGVAKAHGRIVAKCLKDFAAGRLVAMSPELCVRSDPRGKLADAVNRAAQLVEKRCPSGLPAFGVTPIETALLGAVVGQLDMLHAGLGGNLDTALMPSSTDATCQSRVTAAQLRCVDRRLRTFLTCQKRGLRDGTIHDAASLAAVCLGSGAQEQPDPQGRIAADCGLGLAREVSHRCPATDLQRAFAPCEAAHVGDFPGVAACLQRESACALCLIARDAGGLSRDCDLADDGNAANGTCGMECGDGFLQGEESCDDGNLIDNDGCSAHCTAEGGYTCTGEPSVCTPNCGNGALDAGEVCDDGDTEAGDGCSAECFEEEGWDCSGTPSVCQPTCGDGDLDDGEACDDGDDDGGDGCSATCTVEDGYVCSGEPSACTFACGNGAFQGGETCDDGNAMGGDGCSAVCRIEPGWLCFGAPSFCAAQCGDGLRRGSEACDDDNLSSGDGCAFNCLVEPGFQCAGSPSNCVAVCGDGFIRGNENCDDGNSVSGDGCSGTLCRREVGFTCVGQPSACTFDCGDGDLDPLEACDDGGNIDGDGCSAACLGETGYACGGQPSICVPTCGNNVLDADEQCDDGNVVARDGCSDTCRNESGFVCNSPGLPCAPFTAHITAPAHGVFTTAGSVVISGHYTQLPPGQVAVTVNGEPAATLNQTMRTFSHTVPLDADAVYNPVHVVVTNTANGDDVHDRIVVIRGNSVPDPGYATQSVALRVNDSGLDTIEPLVGDLASDQLDLTTLLPSGTELINECFISVIGCWGRARVRIGNPPPSFSNLGVTFDAKLNAVFGDINISNLRIDVDIDGSGLVPDCGLRLTANGMRLTGDYALQPQPGAPTQVDVNLATPIGVTFDNFHHTFTYGLCNAPIIGNIIQAFLPDIQQVASDGIRGFLNDPDGGGPQDSPIADAIESTLAGISISGAVGAGLGLMLDAPLFQVIEDADGITLGADASFTVSVGTGPGQCLPPPGAPDFTASYAKPETFPTYAPNTPVGALPYGLGISISTAGFNQLLRGQTECGLLRTSLDTIDIDGAGGAPPLMITAGLLSLLSPQFGQLDPNLPLRIDVRPTLAPIVTGTSGPGGELTDLRVSQVLIDIVEPGPETVWLSGALDARLGMTLEFLPDGSGLAVIISQPESTDLSITIIENPLGADEAQVETVLPAIIRPLIPELAGALSGFPLPQFLGLSLKGIEVSRNSEFLSLFADLE